MHASPLSQIPRQAIKLIATDMDGTLTQQAQFTPQVLAALAKSTIPIVITTGRSAGWVSGLAHYLPVVGAIAENGGVFFSDQQPQGDFLGNIGDITDHRQELAQLFEQLQQEWPQLSPSTDNAFRLTDWTFDIDALYGAQIDRCAATCEEQGWGFTYSTVQGHLKLPEQDKAQGLKTMLKRHFPQIQPQEVLTIGDSPNDESMFNPQDFPISVGVANIADYCGVMADTPRYLTTAAEGEGFCELLAWLAS